jgi:hypothetical protein
MGHGAAAEVLREAQELWFLIVIGVVWLLSVWRKEHRRRRHHKAWLKAGRPR